MEAVVDFGESSPYDPRRKECKHELGKPKSLVPGISLGEPQRGEPSLDEALVGHGAGPVGFDVPDKNGVHGILNLVETAGEPPPLLTPRELDAVLAARRPGLRREDPAAKWRGGEEAAQAAAGLGRGRRRRQGAAEGTHRRRHPDPRARSVEF